MVMKMMFELSFYDTEIKKYFQSKSVITAVFIALKTKKPYCLSWNNAMNEEISLYFNHDDSDLYFISCNDNGDLKSIDLWKGNIRRN